MGDDSQWGGVDVHGMMMRTGGILLPQCRYIFTIR